MEKNCEDDRKQFLEWSFIRHSTLGNNLMEQDVAKIIAIALEVNIYVIGVSDGGDFAEVTCYGDSGMICHQA